MGKRAPQEAGAAAASGLTGVSLPLHPSSAALGATKAPNVTLASCSPLAPPRSATPLCARPPGPPPGYPAPRRGAVNRAGAPLSGDTGLACPAPPAVTAAPEGPTGPGSGRVGAPGASGAASCPLAGPAHRPGRAARVGAPQIALRTHLPTHGPHRPSLPRQAPVHTEKSLPPPTAEALTNLPSRPGSVQMPPRPYPTLSNTPRLRARGPLSPPDPRFSRPHATNRPQPAAQIFLKTLSCGAGRPHPVAPRRPSGDLAHPPHHTKQ